MYGRFEQCCNDVFLEPVDVASSSEQKEERNKLTSPLKETENEVDVESIEDTAAQNAQSMLIRVRPFSSKLLSLEVQEETKSLPQEFRQGRSLRATNHSVIKSSLEQDCNNLTMFH